MNEEAPSLTLMAEQRKGYRHPILDNKYSEWSAYAQQRDEQAKKEDTDVIKREDDFIDTLANMLAAYANDHAFEWKYSSHERTEKHGIGDIWVDMSLPRDLQAYLTYFATERPVYNRLQKILLAEYGLSVHTHSCSGEKDTRWILMADVSKPTL
jgi:hypothetical protein